jgi:hypothetical protein
MGGLSFSKQKSSATQDQTSASSGLSVNSANSSSLSGGASSGYSSGATGGQSTTGSQSDVFGGDLYTRLRSGALGALDSINPGVATDRVNQLFTGGSSILDRLTGGGAGEDYLTKRLSGSDSSVLDSQISALGSDLGTFLTENVNPILTGNAVAAGQLGGGRQGVAQGQAIKGSLKEFAAQAANLRAADITARDQAATSLIDLQQKGSATALQALPQLASLGSGVSALDPYLAASQVLGGPTVLTQSQGQSSEFGQQYSEQQANEYASSIAQELGISIDEAHSLLKSTSKGSGFSAGGYIGAGGGGSG